MTLRFKIGDRVVCSSEGGWKTATVKCLWAIDEVREFPKRASDLVPHYKCDRDDPTGRWPSLAAPFDNDKCIMRMPDKVRFAVGEKIIFDLYESATAASSGLRTFDAAGFPQWIEATVTKAAFIDTNQGYLSYEVEFGVGQTKSGVQKMYRCVVFDDNDKHICSANATPRKRLFDAIEQDCDSDHLDYLSSTFNIDIITIRDLVISHAIEFCSYKALNWLHNDCNIDVLHMKDSSGNNLLHRIASMPNAVRFTKEAGRLSCLDEDEGPESKLELGTFRNDLTNQLNNNSETWLQILVKRNDGRALDIALSPNNGMAWELSYECALSEENVSSLRDCIQESNNTIMECLLDSFIDFRSLLQQHRTFTFVSSQTEEELFERKELAGYRNDGDHKAKVLTRFVHDYQGICPRYGPTSSALLRQYYGIVMNGLGSFFQYFYKADRNCFRNETFIVTNRTDQNEYIQPQLYSKYSSDGHSIKVGLIDALIIGNGGLGSYSKANESERSLYFDEVKRHVQSCTPDTCHSWLSHLEKIKEEGTFDKIYSLKKYVSHKILLQKDDKFLEGRLGIIDFLLREEPNTSIDVLQTIQHRQCGVLRHLVNKGFVSIDAKLENDTTLAKCLDNHNFQFLDGGRIPASMSIRSFLCFAAVEYDDLQSLEWLCKSCNNVNTSCAGWNLLHVCAFLGRIELVAWLISQPMWQTLKSEACQQRPFEGFCAVHIAAKKGHLIVADLLLDAGSSVLDKRGRSPEYHAKQSPHQFVRKWAEEREKPKTLELNLKMLLELVKINESLESIKDHVQRTKCIDVQIWLECGYTMFNVPGPLGMSLATILCNICETSSQRPELVEWLCTNTLFSRMYCITCQPFWGGDYLAQNGKNGGNLNRQDLLVYAEDNGHSDLVCYLSKRWFKNIDFVDPTTQDFFLSSTLRDLTLYNKIRGKLLRACVLLKITSQTRQKIIDILVQGGHQHDLDELVSINSRARKTLAEEGYACPNFWYSYEQISNICETEPACVDLSVYLEYMDDSHPLETSIPYRDQSSESNMKPVYIALAIEGHYKLLEYCLNKFQGWDAEKEKEVTRAAAFLGNQSVVNLCLDEGKNSLFRSKLDDRYHVAMLGIAEAGLHKELSQLLSIATAPPDPIKYEDITVPLKMSKESLDRMSSLKMNSLGAATIYGYAHKTTGKHHSKTELRTMMVLIDKLQYTPGELMRGLQLLMASEYTSESIVNLVDLLDNLMSLLGLELVDYHDQVQAICTQSVEFFTSPLYLAVPTKQPVDSQLLEWISKIMHKGVDIQGLLPQPMNPMFKLREDFFKSIQMLKDQQLNLWSQYDEVKQGASVDDIEKAIEDGKLVLTERDRGGLLLTHISAAYNRIDLLDWLVTKKGMDLKSKDIQGRTSLDVAKAANAVSATNWISERQASRTIVSFVQRNYRILLAAQRQKRIRSAAVAIQKIYRGHSIRKLFHGLLSHRLEESRRFSIVWVAIVDKLKAPNQAALNWACTREKMSDFNRSELKYDDYYYEDTDEQLSKALEGALQLSSVTVEEMNEEETEEDTPNSTKFTAAPVANEGSLSWLTFQMTSHVVKFLKRGDPKYKSFFVRRMEQLANGDRSRILQKRLTGSQTTIYETYLEQKSGFRILWTETNESGVVIWFVAKHKEVSRLMKLIDDSKSRSKRHQPPDYLVSQLQHDGLLPQPTKKEVLLDVFGNAPLKVYDMNCHSIGEITKENWTPRLHLTAEEREVVEEEGTVLVLGRSGTGKTICIVNRMEYDFQRYGQDQTFSQLFVARSFKLCKYVSEAVGEHGQSTYTTFSELLYELEASSLPELTDSKSFLLSRRIGFARFEEFYDHNASKDSADALVVWSAIRSCLKGSIEAFQSSTKFLSREDFMVVEKLGKNRCRIKEDLREGIYDVFLKYEEYKSDNGLWDDNDRVLNLLLRLDMAKKTESFSQVKRSKIYVDEVQDYTQQEVLLFFYLGNPGSLYFAGDPAQSVVEGTEFRFEEVRSVGYFVAGNDNRNLIPNKPKTVNTNFRSHSGILKTAGAVLDLLFDYFPGSAKQLKKDVGLFHGSRPGFCHKVDVQQLRSLLAGRLNGAVVLTNDSSAASWRRALNYQLVYGIAEAKGLEFKSVIILNFFCELPASSQKAWRNLLLNREGSDFEARHPLVGTHLKQLYTAITRCIETLFFVECSSSDAGDAAVRWLTKARKSAGQDSLVTRNNVNSIDGMSMTADEFLAQGIDNAELAESSELVESTTLLDRAIYCFDQAQYPELATKARTQRLSVQLRTDLAARHGKEKENNNAIAMIETKAAQHMDSLLQEGLITEVMNLFCTISPFLSAYTRDELDKILERQRPSVA